MRKSVTGVIFLEFLVLLSSQCLPGVGASTDATNVKVPGFPASKTRSSLGSKSDAVNGQLLTRLEKMMQDQYASKDNIMRRNNTYQKDNYMLFKRSIVDTMTKKSETTEDECDQYEVNGCSIPFGLPFFYKTQFTSSCNRHDVCYQCGIDYGVGRRACDDEFLTNMREACRSRAYHLQKWHILGSSNRSQHEMSLHRQKIQALIEEKSSILKNIFKREFKSSTENMAVNFLMNSEKSMISLMKRVLSKWILILANDLESENGYKDIDLALYRSFPFHNNWSQRAAGNPLQRILNSRRDRRFSFYEVLSTSHSPTKKRTYTDDIRERVKKNIDHISRIENNRVCMQILREADRVSMLQWQYRVSDRIDCFDILGLHCQFFARVYYYGVRIGGSSSYRGEAADYCDEDFVLDCLPE